MSPVTELVLPDDLFLKIMALFWTIFSKSIQDLQKALGWHGMLPDTSLHIRKLHELDLDFP